MKYRDYFYIKYIDETEGFGVFTKYLIPAKTVIGFLGGVVSFKPQYDTVFWPYASDINTGKDIYIDFG